MKKIILLLFTAAMALGHAQQVSQLPAGSTVTDTDLIPTTQGYTGTGTGTTGAITALQLKTYAQNGTVLTSGSYANPLWITSLAYSKLTGAPSSLPPSGTAGGDLGGTYPNPTVIGLNGTPLSSLTTGLLKNTTGTGIPAIAIAGTDYITPAEASSLYVPVTLTVNGHALSGNITISASDITTGTLPIGQIPTGTSSSTVAIGNDSRITGALQSSVAATTYQPLNSTLTAFSGGNTFTAAGLLTISGTWPNLTLTVPTGTTSSTAAAGNDTRFPASVTGLRKSAGAGSTDTAAVPDTDYAGPTTVFQNHMGPTAHNFLFLGDSITEGPHGNQAFAQQSIAAVAQSLGLGAGGATMYDMGLKQEITAWITQAWFGKNGPGTQIATTATFTSGATTITVASSTGMAVGDSILSIGIPVDDLITAISGTSVTIASATTSAQTSTPCCATVPPKNVLYSELYPGGQAQGWAGFHNSGQQLCQYSGIPTDVYLLSGANDYTANQTSVTPTISTTSGSTSITLSSGTSVVPGMGIVSANLPANTILVSGSGTSWTASQMAIYSAAFDTQDFTASTILQDTPVVFDDPDNQVRWKPENSHMEFKGDVTVRTAIQMSMNIPAVKTLEKVGMETAIQYARRLGITTKINRDFSMALGASCVTMWDLCGVYGVFANLGYKPRFELIRRIVDRDGHSLETHVDPGDAMQPLSAKLLGVRDEVYHPKDLVLDPVTSFLIYRQLVNVVNGGTGSYAAKTGKNVAGKTGTTNEQFDAWFMGFSRDLVTGVWVGHDKNERPLGALEFGGRAALPIWTDYMIAALRGIDQPPLEEPEGIVTARINPDTGMLASDGRAVTEYYRKGTEPKTKTGKDTGSDSFYKADSNF